MFRALVIDQNQSGMVAQVKSVKEEELPDGDVTVSVRFSTLNYKDGMIMNGVGRLVASYPHVPGVDAAGVVTASSDPRFDVGDEVIVGGQRFGEIIWGGYAELVKVPGNMVVKLPPNLSLRQSMAFGTAGLSAMLAIMALEHVGLKIDEREVLVTGAVGGVGSVAVALLAALGYKVAASTGRLTQKDYLFSLGANSVIDRSEFEQESTRPLERERWIGCIDNVGGTTLGRVISQMARTGSIASVGLAGGGTFTASVMPFLLRGVNLVGIDSVSASADLRTEAWNRLATSFPLALLDSLVSEVPLEEVASYGSKILAGSVKGRIVVTL